MILLGVKIENPNPKYLVMAYRYCNFEYDFQKAADQQMVLNIGKSTFYKESAKQLQSTTDTLYCFISFVFSDQKLPLIQ